MSDQSRPEPLRREDPRLLMGRARFVDDVHLDRMVHGAFVRSPHAHAEILGIDTSAARAAGALLVLTAADLPFNDRPWVVRYWHESIRGGMPKFLATDRIRFVGDPIAFVVAEDRYRAEDLAALVSVTYRPLPALTSIAAARAPGAPQLHPTWHGNVAASFRQASGDADAALCGAAHRVRRCFSFARQAPLALECRGIVADFDAHRDTLTAWMSTQAHYNVRQNLSTILDVPEYQVRVIAEDVGGGFGAKSRTYAEELVASHASRCLGRPVKWIEDRFENLRATTHSRAIDVDLELGCDADGVLAALKAEVVLDLGGYVFTSGVMTAEIAAANLANTYRVPNVVVDVTCVGTNKTPIATYRGAGQPEAAFPMECLLDVLAKTIGLSSAELRRRNMVTPTDMPYALGRKVAGMDMVFDSGDFPELLERTMAASGYHERVEMAPDGRRVAWGLASGLEGSGFVNFETATVRVDQTGGVTVFSGMSTQGQGQLTTYALVCADALGVPFERVRIQLGDTQLMPFGRGAFASRGAVFGASAVHVAASLLKEKVLAHAAVLLQTTPAALDLLDGRVVRRDGGETALAVGDVARAVAPGGPLFSGEAALEATHVYKAERPVTYGSSAHAVKVALDPRTGFFDILDYVIGHDAGRAMHKVIVEGQIVGGAIDGIGGALLSELVYGADGQLLTDSLNEYLVAMPPALPTIRLTEMETLAPTNPLGVRGIGEGGLIPTAAAIANALSRAIDPDGIGHETPLFTLPLKPERVLAACRAAGLAGAAAQPVRG